MPLQAVLSIMRYPLRTGSLFFIVICTLLLSVARFAVLFFGPAGFVSGIVLGVFVLLWYARYLFFILEYTALGHADPPIFEWEMVSPVDRPRTLFMGVLLMTIIGVGNLVYSHLGNTLFTTYLVVAVVYFPATLCVISVDQHMIRVFDPVRAFRLIANLGPHYLTILAAIVAAISAIALIFGTSNSVFLTSAILFYGGVWLFHVIGLVLYTHRDAIGLDAERAPERDQEKVDAGQMRAQNQLLDQLFPLSRAGKYANAMQIVDDYLKQHPDSQTEQRLFDALIGWENPYLGLVLAQQQLERLLGANDKVSALQLCARCLASDDRYRPKGADTTIRMAEVAATDGRPAIALDLLRDFMNRFPDHPSELRVLNLLIPLAAQRDNDEEFVRELLRHYLATVPVDQRSPEIAALIPLYDDGPS